MKPTKHELIVDNFAGGGGASLGIENALRRPVDYAINHDPEAVAMHTANHPHTQHFCESVWDVNPREIVRGRPMGLGWFSPDCTHHSKARGGKPFRDRDASRRRRGLAWLVMPWITLDDLLLMQKHTNPGVYYLIGGRSKTGCGHSVIACGGEIVWDPSLDDAGIVGPMDDGFYWVQWLLPLAMKKVA